MDKYKLYFADLGKLSGRAYKGARPFVVIGKKYNGLLVLSCTGRNRGYDNKYIKMNDYLTHSYCNCSEEYWIPENSNIKYIRDLTTSEINAINERKQRLKLENRYREYRKRY